MRVHGAASGSRGATPSHGRERTRGPRALDKFRDSFVSSINANPHWCLRRVNPPETPCSPCSSRDNSAVILSQSVAGSLGTEFAHPR